MTKPKAPKKPKVIPPKTKVYFIAPANEHPSEAWKTTNRKTDLYRHLAYAKSGLANANKYSGKNYYAIYEIDLMQAVNKLDSDLENVINEVKI